MCYFSIKQAALRSENKDFLTQSQYNVSESNDIYKKKCIYSYYISKLAL